MSVFGVRRIQDLDFTSSHRQKLKPRCNLKMIGKHSCFLDTAPCRKLSMMGKEDCPLVAERGGYKFTLVIADRRSWPMLKEGAIIKNIVVSI